MRLSLKKKNKKKDNCFQKENISIQIKLMCASQQIYCYTYYKGDKGFLLIGKCIELCPFRMKNPSTCISLDPFPNYNF